MNRQDLIKVTSTFVMLFMVSLGMIVGAHRWASNEIQQVLVPVGSAILGGTLAFYLVEMFEIERTSRE